MTSRTCIPTSTSPTSSSQKCARKADLPAPARREDVFRILAVDPGTNRTGYGVLERVSGEMAALAYGVIRNPPHNSAAAKLERIHRRIVELLIRYRPQVLVLEEIFYHRSVRTALKLGEVRGACLVAAARQSVPVYSYAPRRVKKAVVGFGGAGKIQVQKMVQLLLGLERVPSPPDVADALALGITYFQDRRLSEYRQSV